jgi:uncharacterized protein YqjF (DUF2071 family)
MSQTWRDLLFAHWPVPAETLAAHMPAGLIPDQHSGSAWLGIIPFRMTSIRLYGLPAVPFLSETLELNVRTYATWNGIPGVYFFSLDAQNRIAVRVARRFFHLPYFDAAMSCRRNGTFHYESRRREGYCCRVDYEPTGAPKFSEPGSLDYFLTERYALYTTDVKGQLYRGKIQHNPWSLQPAIATFHENTMTESLGLTLAGSPRLRFSRELEVSILGLAPC